VNSKGDLVPSRCIRETLCLSKTMGPFLGNGKPPIETEGYNSFWGRLKPGNRFELYRNIGHIKLLGVLT
jgi:hypothetical protein